MKTQHKRIKLGKRHCLNTYIFKKRMIKIGVGIIVIGMVLLAGHFNYLDVNHITTWYF